MAFVTVLDWINFFYEHFEGVWSTLCYHFDFNTYKLWRKKQLLRHLNLLCYEKKIYVILLLTPLSVICIPYGLAQFIILPLICVFSDHPFGWLPPPLPRSLRARAPGKHRRAFGTCNLMNFSFPSLRQLSPPLSNSHSLPLSLTSIVSCSHHASTPASPLNGG